MRIAGLLLWKSKKKGAIELIPYVDAESGYFGYDEFGHVFLLIGGKYSGYTTLYTANIDTLEWEKKELEPVAREVKSVTFHLSLSRGHYLVQCKDGSEYNIFCKEVEKDNFSTQPKKIQVKSPLSYGQLKKFVNCGYNAIKRVEEVFINEFGELSIGNKTLLHFGVGYLAFTIKDSQERMEKADTIYEDIQMNFNPLVKLRKFTFNDGSEVYIDSRGLIHLVSSDVSLYEVTATFIENKPAGLWASNGDVFSFDYFNREVEDNHDDDIDIASFYRAYIQRFADHIINHE